MSATLLFPSNALYRPVAILKSRESGEAGETESNGISTSVYEKRIQANARS
jgi:hypothetical protein